MIKITPALSKAVGWEPRKRTLVYPTEQDVKNASAHQLLELYRFLPSPKNEKEKHILDMICNFEK